MSPKKLSIWVAAFGLVIVVGLQLGLYNLDRNPVGQWQGERMIRREIKALADGSDSQRIWAAQRLSLMAMDRDDARHALKRALKDSNPMVAANAKLSLRFYLHDTSINVNRETFRLAALAPRDPLYSAH